MFKWIKNKWRRRQYRKAIKNAFLLTRHLYPNISQYNKSELYEAMKEFLNEYQLNWGTEDGVIEFYYEELNRICLKGEEKS